MHTINFGEPVFDMLEILRYKSGFVIPRIMFNDGVSVSIQCHWGAYCDPRPTTGENWSLSQLPNNFEAGFPSTLIDELMPYAEEQEHPTETVYPHVPCNVIEGIIKSHGGIVKLTSNECIFKRRNYSE